MTAAVRLAQALHDADAVVTCVPGFGGTQVFEAYGALRGAAPVWSFHEEVAFTVAHGAALAGRRAAALLKTHGLAKAANSALDAVTAGVTAGCVVVVFDDPAGLHSDSVADPVRLLDGESERIPRRVGPSALFTREVARPGLESRGIQRVRLGTHLQHDRVHLQLGGAVQDGEKLKLLLLGREVGSRGPVHVPHGRDPHGTEFPHGFGRTQGIGNDLPVRDGSQPEPQECGGNAHTAQDIAPTLPDRRRGRPTR